MKTFWSNGAFDAMDRRYYNLINRLGTAAEFLHADFKNAICEEFLFNKFSKYFNNPDTKSYFNKMTHFDMFGSLHGLLQVEDRVSMSVSIESRVPLLDRRIVDLVSRMPARMKFKGGEMKYLLKKVAKDVLPEEILHRKDKMGFPVPLHIWLKGKTKKFVADILLSQQSKERGIIDIKATEKLIDHEQPFDRSLWGFLCLELWFKQFIDK